MSRYIDAEKLCFEILEEYGISTGGDDVTEIYGMIINQPTADVRENVRGEWIYWYEKIENDTCTEYRPHCKCSECGTEYDSHTVKFINFCPNCGAKMSHTKEKNHDKSDQSNRCRRA